MHTHIAHGYSILDTFEHGVTGDPDGNATGLTAVQLYVKPCWTKVVQQLVNGIF